jgi:hypothetical protein
MSIISEIQRSQLKEGFQATETVGIESLDNTTASNTVRLRLRQPCPEGRRIPEASDDWKTIAPLTVDLFLGRKLNYYITACP